MKNDDELVRTIETLMEIYGGEDKVLTGSDEQWRGAAVSLVPFRSMQRPRSRKTMSFTAVAVLRRADALRREVEDEKEKRGK